MMELLLAPFYLFFYLIFIAFLIYFYFHIGKLILRPLVKAAKRYWVETDPTHHDTEVM